MQNLRYPSGKIFSSKPRVINSNFPPPLFSTSCCFYGKHKKVWNIILLFGWSRISALVSKWTPVAYVPWRTLTLFSVSQVFLTTQGSKRLRVRLAIGSKSIFPFLFLFKKTKQKNYSWISFLNDSSSLSCGGGVF